MQRFVTTIKNVTEKKKEKKKLKSLIRLHSANKIDNYNRGGKKEKRFQKNLQNNSKYKNNKCFSSVTAFRVLYLAGSQSLPHFPGVPSDTVLISGPACGDSSDSNLVLLLCILASNVHSYQN